MLDSLLAVADTPQARFILYGTAAILALGVSATLYALWLSAKSARWARTGGRILSSKQAFDLIQAFKTEAPRNRRVARITYGFEVVGKTFRSNRILDSGEPPEDQVDRLLADYPVGKAVIVRYDPRDPGQSALEIASAPPDLAKGCAVATLLLLGAAVFAIWITTVGGQQLVAAFPDAILPVMLATFVAGCVFLFVFYLFARQAAEVRRWHETTATIVSSGVRSFSVLRDEPKKTFGGRSRRRTGYMPIVEFAYSVNGEDYSSRSIYPDTEVSGDAAYAQRIVDRYEPGDVVTILYDPERPQRAALEPGGRLYWLALVGAVVAFAAAAATSGWVF